MRVYLDNAATTRVDPRVVKIMDEFFLKNYGNASSIHQGGRKARESLESARVILARNINADPNEIIFTSGGTESDNLAIKGVAYANREKGDRIITSKIEHHAVLNTCAQLGREGFAVDYVDVDKKGFVDLKQLNELISDRTILVTIMHANNEIGTIQDIEGIGKLCRERGVLFHTDAVQSFTKTPIDVKKQQLDLVSLSGHKIHGPKGVGALFVRNGVKLARLFDGGEHEFGLRPGTENVPGVVGFAEAVELAKDEHIQKMTTLRDHLIHRVLAEIPDVQLNGPQDRRLCNNASFTFKFVEGESILMALDAEEISVSTGSACSSKSLEPSHVLSAIGLRPEDSHGSIRMTLSRETTREEIDHAVDTLKAIVAKFRKISPFRGGVHVH